jgi:uncharacterized protein (TIGR03000 family)
MSSCVADQITSPQQGVDPMRRFIPMLGLALAVLLISGRVATAQDKTPQDRQGQDKQEQRQLAPDSNRPADTGNAPAEIRVQVPPDAEVWFDGTRTQQRGFMRRYATPPLSSGEHSYELKARWLENGREVEKTQKVTVRPGAVVNVQFRPGSSRDQDMRGRPDRAGEPAIDRDNVPRTPPNSGLPTPAPTNRQNRQDDGGVNTNRPDRPPLD